VLRIVLLGLLSAALIGVLAHRAQAQTESSATATQQATTTQGSATSTSDASFDPLNPHDVEAKVREAFADVPIMIAIAQCESGFRQFDEFGNPLFGGSGGMVGVFQEAAAVHGTTAKGLGYDINTLDGNIAFARYLYETEGTVPWLGSAGCWDPTPLTQTLKLGSVGPQVRNLQIILNRIGYQVATSGPGSPGKETDTFGVATRAAVRRFQCDMDIACSGSERTNGYGMVGAKTRLALVRVSGKTTAATSESPLSVQ